MIPIIHTIVDECCWVMRILDQRNYEIAIQVSQLESTTNNLRLEVAKKASVVDDLGRDVSEKDKRIAELEKDKR